jgi:hypothetical protein
VKVFVLTAACLFFSGIVFAECVVVTAGNSQQPLILLHRSRNIQVTVNLDGKPLPEAPVTVYTDKDQLLFAASTDAHGVAKLRDLEPGRYEVIGMSADGARSSLLLDVSAKAKKSLNSFSLNLFTTFGLFNVSGDPRVVRQLFLARVAKMAVSQKLRGFTGMVRDASGAAIPGAFVEIFPDGTWEQASATVLKTDGAGHFSVKLPSGLYRTIIHAMGFNPYPVVFEITQDGESEDLLVVLQVGHC